MLAAPALPPPPITQAQRAAEQHAAVEASDGEFAGQRPFAHLLKSPSFRPWTLVDVVMTRTAQNALGRLVLRRSQGRIRTAPPVDYADAATCPGLTEAVLAMEDLTPPPLDVPGLGRFEPPPPTPDANGRVDVIVTGDGTGYRVWTASTSINVGQREPAAAWAERLLSVAAVCWRARAPTP